MSARIEIKLITEATNMEPDAARQQAVDQVQEIEGLDVVASSAAYRDEEYTVVGVIKGKPSERWQETVRAQSPEEAEEKATAEDVKRTVAHVIEPPPGQVIRVEAEDDLSVDDL